MARLGERALVTVGLTLQAAGQPMRQALERANAAGALAVGKLGPMEGNSSLPEIDAVRAVSC